MATMTEEPTGRWVCSWACAPQQTDPVDFPPAPFRAIGALADATLRQTIHVSLGGERIRLRLSNAFGRAALTVTAVTVASPAGGTVGVTATEPDSAQTVTFGGRTPVRIPAGTEALSDPIPLTVPPGANLTVMMRLATVPQDVTSHPGSRTTSYVEDVPVDHWYFLSGLEVWSPQSAAAVAALGDSLTDGRGSTTNGNDRWPDLLSARLRANPDTTGVAVVNLGIGGNRMLHDGLGPAGLARWERDILLRRCVGWLIVFEGVNDIGTAAATSTAQEAVAAELITAYQRIVSLARAKGIRAYGATLTPFGGNEAYDDPSGRRESARSAVNQWIRTAGSFDEVLDFDLATRDPNRPRCLLGALDEGDHLHLNPAGYRAIAESIPLSLFAGPSPR
jgi:lysophospholipase L1-like esterase